MRKKKQKPMYLRVRLPRIRQTGGAHQPEKGGKHRRNREKQKTQHEIQAEFK
ncbi:MAG: hypothetical protein Q8R55_07270 [Candidatus Taylorbacteria bacterium]|nr:hypothetical protein [Candidatus Taylorbacteria bacterium]